MHMTVLKDAKTRKGKMKPPSLLTTALRGGAGHSKSPGERVAQHATGQRGKLRDTQTTHMHGNTKHKKTQYTPSSVHWNFSL